MEHIPGKVNHTADDFSHGNMQSFFGSNLQALLLPVPIPELLLMLLSTTNPEWTLPIFRRLFNSTINMV